MAHAEAYSAQDLSNFPLLRQTRPCEGRDDGGGNHCPQTQPQRTRCLLPHHAILTTPMQDPLVGGAARGHYKDALFTLRAYRTLQFRRSQR